MTHSIPIETCVDLGDKVDISSLMVSNEIASRLLISKHESSDAIIYASFMSTWKVLLFDDIRRAIVFKQHKDTYYLCITNVKRLNESGWSLPLDINPDMTRVVKKVDKTINYACISLPFVNVHDHDDIKIFVECHRRSEGGSHACPPLSLWDREYLFHHPALSSPHSSLPPPTPSSSGTVDGKVRMSFS